MPQPISLAQQALVWFTTLAPKWETGGDGGVKSEVAAKNKAWRVTNMSHVTNMSQKHGV